MWLENIPFHYDPKIQCQPKLRTRCIFNLPTFVESWRSKRWERGGGEAACCPHIHLSTSAFSSSPGQPIYNVQLSSVAFDTPPCRSRISSVPLPVHDSTLSRTWTMVLSALTFLLLLTRKGRSFDVGLVEALVGVRVCASGEMERESCSEALFFSCFPFGFSSSFDPAWGKGNRAETGDFKNSNCRLSNFKPPSRRLRSLSLEPLQIWNEKSFRGVVTKAALFFLFLSSCFEQAQGLTGSISLKDG